jgi:hypothetical protein
MIETAIPGGIGGFFYTIGNKVGPFETTINGPIATTGESD